MSKIWLKNYNASIAPEIDLSEYSSIDEIVVKSCERFQGRPAFTNMGTTISYKELNELTQNFASYLLNCAGLKKGDRIILQLPNILQYPVALFGALRAGLVVVNTNPLYTTREMEHQFKDSGAKAIVILANFAKNLEEVLPKTQIQTVIVTQLGDLLYFPKSQIVNFVLKYIKKLVPPYQLSGSLSFKEALRMGSLKTLQPPKMEHEDLAFLQYTGGTTGVAKGAMLSHKNIIANMLQIYAWISSVLIDGKEIVVSPLPLYHIFSLTVNCLAFIKSGAQNLLITNPRDFPAFIQELSIYPVTLMTGVNTLFNALLNQPSFAKLDFSTWKGSVGAGMAVQRAVADQWKTVTGIELTEAYGLTETSPALTCNPLGWGQSKDGTIGIPLPSTEISIRNEKNQEVPLGESGEICARGPQVMKGYWNRPDETALVLKEGWFYTGDIGIMDADGYTKIIDRKKDMILVSGFNVYPNEIEDVVAAHPKVLEVAAVGIPDEHSGEVVKIFVVKKDKTLSADELKKYCKDKLTAYKLPRSIEFRSELPKSNVGKILRRLLREEALK